MEKQWSRISAVKMHKKMRQTLPGSSGVSVLKQVCGEYRWVMSSCHWAPGTWTGVNTQCHQTGAEERGWGETVRRLQQSQTQMVQPRFHGCWESPSSAVGESRDLPLTPPCPPCPLRNFPIPAHSSELQTTPEPLHPGIYNKHSEF